MGLLKMNRHEESVKVKDFLDGSFQFPRIYFLKAPFLPFVVFFFIGERIDIQ
jgi:hypothetical protein